ncbi:hypothetical protein D9757_004783 [Collybiopsis confluens]|uniref:Protein kinase domain-containing protein n=1 Tax=Collybiopsis confluens TaxID=2823264 RepID=A0A8H5MCA6_9AGAR|nr:hypothetical protein D9757_004783 [Collybiopsis confluens]
MILPTRCLGRIARRNLASLVNGRKPAQEPLYLSADDGYGFARIKSGADIGQHSRFSIVRRLGWRMYSSTWLAKDHKDEKHVAIKILTGFATRLYLEGLFPELGHSSKVSATPSGAEPKEDVFGGDVEYVYALPAITFKSCQTHSLKGLNLVHREGVVHADLKHDNIPLI